MSFIEEEPIKAPHQDYSKNLDQSIQFMKNVQRSLLRGMSVSVTDASKTEIGLQKCLLNIGFKAPDENHPFKSRFWTPITMHQPNREFSKEVETVFNSYIGMVKGFESEVPRFVQKDLLEGKV